MKQFNKMIMVVSLLAIGFSPAIGIKAAGLATFSLSPLNQDVNVNDTFEIEVQIQPNGESLDTVRANIEFPADLVEVDHYLPGDLFERVTPANYIKNNEGEASEGAFTLQGPVTSSGVLGVFTFRAKAEGEAQIKISDTSRAISAGEEKINTSSLGSANVVIGAKAEEELPEGVSKISVASVAHPDQRLWSNKNDIDVTWSNEGETEIAKYFVGFDEHADTDPKENVGSATSKTYTDVADGIWYFHVKGQQKDNQFTNTVHYKLKIDTTPPNKLEPITDEIQLAEGDWTMLNFGTTDDLSGVMGYEISVNGSDFEQRSSPIKFENLAKGDYFIEVRATDLAGNVIYGNTTMRVYPKDVYPSKEKGTKSFDITENRTVQIIIVVAVLLIVLGLLLKLKKRK